VCSEIHLTYVELKNIADRNMDAEVNGQKQPSGFTRKVFNALQQEATSQFDDNLACSNACASVPGKLKFGSLNLK